MASSGAVNGQGLYKKALQFLSKRKKTRTYIFPTSFGFAFGAMALVLFFLAVGYANNLIYIFVFFLISVAFTGVFITNRNVDGVELVSLQADEFLPMSAEKSWHLLKIPPRQHGSLSRILKKAKIVLF